MDVDPVPSAGGPGVGPTPAPGGGGTAGGGAGGATGAATTGGTLKRSSSAPMINELVSQAQNICSSASTSRYGRRYCLCGDYDRIGR